MHCRQSVSRAWVPTVQMVAHACSVLRAARQLPHSVQLHARHVRRLETISSAQMALHAACARPVAR